MKITYRFHLPDGNVFEFPIHHDREYTDEIDSKELPFWTKLDYHQCPNCPLSKDDFKNCPVAVDLQDVVERFSAILSVTNVKVEVETPQRTYIKECDAQTGLDSLLGLIMATSWCPILGTFRSMAKTHLPFSTFEESTVRAIGNYLTKQYFLAKEGYEPDLELKGLMEFYEEIGTVNQHFADRVRDASEKDAGVNAVIQLSALSITVGASIEDSLDELKGQFIDE